MPKIKVNLSIGFVGANHEDVLEISDEEWNECNDKEKLMLEYWQDWANNYIEGTYNLIEE